MKEWPEDQNTVSSKEALAILKSMMPRLYRSPSIDPIEFNAKLDLIDE